MPTSEQQEFAARLANDHKAFFAWSDALPRSACSKIGRLIGDPNAFYGVKNGTRCPRRPLRYRMVLAGEFGIATQPDPKRTKAEKAFLSIANRGDDFARTVSDLLRDYLEHGSVAYDD